MKTNHIFSRRWMLIIIFIAVLCICIGYWERDVILAVIRHEPIMHLSHKPDKGDSWVLKDFQKAGLWAFINECENCNSMAFSDSADEVVGKWKGNPDYSFTIRVIQNTKKQSPADIANSYYQQLSDEQKVNCSIQNADQALEYFPDGALAGQPMNLDDPHPTDHKTRFKIDIRPDVNKALVDKYGGIPPTPEYDYICGHAMGSPLEAHPPYLEFDDRTPDKYLLVGLRGQDAPPIDLNSIRF